MERFDLITCLRPVEIKTSAVLQGFDRKGPYIPLIVQDLYKPNGQLLKRLSIDGKSYIINVHYELFFNFINELVFILVEKRTLPFCFNVDEIPTCQVSDMDAIYTIKNDNLRGFSHFIAMEVFDRHWYMRQFRPHMLMFIHCMVGKMSVYLLKRSDDKQANYECKVPLEKITEPILYVVVADKQTQTFTLDYLKLCITKRNHKKDEIFAQGSKYVKRKLCEGKENENGKVWCPYLNAPKPGKLDERGVAWRYDSAIDYRDIGVQTEHFLDELLNIYTVK